MRSGASSGWLWWGGVGFGLTLVVLSNLVHDALFHGRPLEASESPKDPAVAEAGPPGVVTLTEGKRKAAGLLVEPAERTTLAEGLDLPATVEANPDRRVSVSPRVVGVIREVRAQIGQVVEAGDVLAVLDSADVGTARLDLRAKRLELSLARVEDEWAVTVAKNVEELTKALDEGTTAAAIEKLFAERPLGVRRSELLSSYADFEMARHEEAKQLEFSRKKIVGEHPVVQAIHARESAQAKYEAALEQVRYDAQQQKRRADQAVVRADAAVVDAAQRLRILGVEPGPDPESEGEDVTAYEIRAPFDGTITARSAVPSRRVEMADVLFTLADLTTVRVAAHVPESRMAALADARPGMALTITAAAYPGRAFAATLLAIGAEVDPLTRTVTLLAEAPNDGGLLRPQMFARIALPGATAEEATTVPAAAVVEIEGTPHVFVPEGGAEALTFRARAVEAGREADGRRVILSGVAPGEAVVAAGAFALKSELILRNEPDED